MKCPHCHVSIHENFAVRTLVKYEVEYAADGEQLADAETWRSYDQRCPNCHNAIIYLEAYSPGEYREDRFLAYPRSSSRPVPSEVTDPYRQDFEEACQVLPFSPKASAALSRRCLQAILKDKAGAKKKDLFDQIEEIAGSGKVPSYIAEGLHAVRNIGNFGAHPQKSTVSDAILDVEPGEAEWNLDILELLFDFYFVQPAISATRKAALNKKLSEAGKPPIK